LHLLGIVEDAAEPEGIYEQLWNLKGNEAEQARVLGDWARSTFQMTANLDENATLSSSEESPCKQRCCQTSNVEQDQASLCNFCQIHKCNDYCLRTKKEKKVTSDINPDTKKRKVSHFTRCLHTIKLN